MTDTNENRTTDIMYSNNNENGAVQSERTPAGSLPDIPCEVVRDLLPLYADHVTSDETASIVNRHLSACDGCREEYQQIVYAGDKISAAGSSIGSLSAGADGTDMGATLVRGNTPSAAGTPSNFAATLTRIRNAGIVRGAVLILLVIALLGGGLGFLNNYPIVNFAKDSVEAQCVYRFDFDRLDGSGIFLIAKYQYPGTMVIKPELSSDGKVLNFAMKKTVLGSFGRSKDSYTKTALDYEFTPADGIDEVQLNGVTVWTAADGVAKEVPEYVDEYNKIFNSRSDDKKYAGASWDYFTTDDIVRIEYGDGTIKTWTYDGKVISMG